MGTAALAGVFGLLALLVQGLINVGTRPTRWRRAITQDLDLLAKLRESFPDSSGVWDLEERIDRHLVEYAWLGAPGPDESGNRSAATRGRERRTKVREIGTIVVTLTTALTLGALLAQAGEDADMPRVVAVAFGLAAALLGSAAGVAGGLVLRRFRDSAKRRTQHRLHPAKERKA